jgi:hypothetical protein
LRASSAKALENAAPGGSEDGLASAAQWRVVEHVVVHERGGVDQLDGRRSPRQRDVGVAAEPGHEHEQRAQALATGRHRRQRVLLDSGDLAQPRLDADHRGSQLFAPEFENRVERVHDRLDQATSPTCMAMIPPAVST